MSGDGKMPVPKKAYGQNFIINPGICPKMVTQSGLDGSYGVVEIGPGLGALTRELAAAARKVVAIEIDGELIPKLEKETADFDNIEIVHGDVMKLDLKELIETRFAGMDVAVFGNLPYYITSPIIMKLLEDRLPIKMVTAMVQREAAERLCAEPGSRETGAVSLAVRYYSVPRILFDVAPGSFYPRPKVTSSVIKLDVLEQPAVRPADEGHMFAIIKAAFSQRRKTAANSVSSGTGINKSRIIEALGQIDVSADIRPERLTIAQFAALSDLLADKKEENSGGD